MGVVVGAGAGFVMTWGTGYFGQLGHGDNASYRHPKLLRRLDPHRLGERVTQVWLTLVFCATGVFVFSSF